MRLILVLILGALCFWMALHGWSFFLAILPVLCLAAAIMPPDEKPLEEFPEI